jgi:hypothetical protein
MSRSIRPVLPFVLGVAVATAAFSGFVLGRFKAPSAPAAKVAEQADESPPSPAAAPTAVAPARPVVAPISLTAQAVSSPPPVERAATAAEELEGQLRTLADSGPADSKWLGEAAKMTKQWLGAAAEAGFSPAMSDWRCYAKGCTTTVTKLANDHMSVFSELITQSSTFQEWPGGKFRSGPIEHNAGQPEITWIFFLEGSS